MDTYWFMIKGRYKNNKEKDISGKGDDWVNVIVKVRAKTMYQAEISVIGLYGSDNFIIDYDNSYVLLEEIVCIK